MATDTAAPPQAAARTSAAAAWIPVMISRIVSQHDPLKIVLFGSHARGEAHDESDIDLLVVMPDEWAGLRQRQTAVAILHSLRDLPVFKDIVVTTSGEIARRQHVTGTVLRQALQEGRVLYERR